jgi:TP901 family phage tail tape measure protein
MADYNLGTARGVITIDSTGATTGAKTASDALEDVDKKAGNGTKSWGKVGTASAIAGGLVAGALGLAVRSAADFESSLSGIKAVSGATAAEMKQVSDKALKIGADTAFSASEGALAIEELAKAGISLPNIMNGAADSTVALAAAGGISLPEAATIAANAMNQFGLSADDMPNIADKIAGAANASAIDIGDFGQSLSQVGAVANLTGFSFDDISVAIAEMGNAGIKGSDAGTSLKSMMMRLIPQTDEAAGLMESMGLLTIDTKKSMEALRDKGIKPASSSMEDITAATSKYIQASTGAKVGSKENAAATQDLLNKTLEMDSAFFDANGKVESLASIQGSLQKATKDMSEEQKLATLTTLFGSDAIRGVAVLAKNGTKGYEDMAGAMGKVSAADVAKTRLDNLSGSMEAMKGSLETAAITLGTILLPALRAIVDKVTEVLNWFTSLSGGTQKIIIGVALAAAGALLFVAALVKVTQAIQTTKATLALLTTGTKLFGKEGKITSAITKIWSGIQAVFNGIMAMNPVILIVIAIVALVAILIIAYKKSDKFRAIVDGAFRKVKEAAQAVVAWFTDTLLPVFKSVWEGIKNAVSSAVTFIKTVIGNVFNVIKTIITTYINLWKLIITTVFNAIKTVITNVVNGWKLIITTVFNAIKTAFTFYVNAWKLIITTVFNVIKTFITNVVNGIKIIITTVFNAIKTFITNVVNGWKIIITTVFNAIKTFIRNVVNGIKIIITTVFNAVKAFFTTVFGIIKGIVQRAVDGWKNIFAKVAEIVGKVVEGFQRMKDKIAESVGKIKDKVVEIKDKIMGVFSGAKDWLFDIGKKIIQGLIDGFKNMFGTVKNTLTGLTDKIFGWKGPERKDKKLLVKPGRWIVGGLNEGLLASFKDTKKLLAAETTKIGSSVNVSMPSAPTPEMIAKKAAFLDNAKRQKEKAVSQQIIFNNNALKKETSSEANARQLRALRVSGAI